MEYLPTYLRTYLGTYYQEAFSYLHWYLVGTEYSSS